MFNQQYYDLIRQKTQSYNAQLERLYVPLQDEKPGFIRRLLGVLRGIHTEQTAKTVEHSQPQHSQAGA